MVLRSRPRLGADSAPPLTLAQARDKVGDAIDFAELAAQNAQPGDPIFGAIANAKQVKASIEDRIPFWSLGGDPAPAAVVDQASATESAIFDAAAQIRSDPDTPTVYAAPKAAIPWGLLAVGAVGLGGAAWLTFGRKRRAAA